MSTQFLVYVATDLEMLRAMMNLPLPVARKSFTGHVGAISDALKLRCDESMHKACELVKRLENKLGQESEDGIYNIAVSHDATWQITSLYGAVFVSSELSGQVLDYEFMSKTCSSCCLWTYQDHSSPA